MSKLRSGERSERRPHDSVYRRLFSNRRLVEDLIRRFLPGAWTKKLDFSTLELLPSHYVSRFLDQRESDLVWRLRYGPGKDEWFYVYVLMELQSTVDRFMALRLWAYLALFYQDLLKRDELTTGKLLPPAVPVVLYTGEERWTAPTRLADLLETIEGIEPPSFEYVVLDASHYPTEDLEPVTDVASGVFLMEQAVNLEQLRAIVDRVREIVGADDRLDEDFALLVNSVLGKLSRQGDDVPHVSTLMEARNMLAERAVKWTEQWLEEGRQEGRKEGRKEGRQEGRKEGRKEGHRLGMVEVLKKLAIRRFGELPAWAIEHLDRADVDTLECWSGRLLEAERLEDVFEPS